MTNTHNTGWGSAQRPDHCETSFQAVLGAVLQQERETRGLSQAQVADAAGVTQSAWSRVERGALSPSPDQLLRAARLMRTTLTELTDQAERHLGNLEARGVHVRATRRASQQGDSDLKWVAGAALVGLLLWLASRK